MLISLKEFFISWVGELFSVKDQVVSILNFIGHKDNVTTTQVCPIYSTKVPLEIHKCIDVTVLQ